MKKKNVIYYNKSYKKYFNKLQLIKNKNQAKNP